MSADPLEIAQNLLCTSMGVTVSGLLSLGMTEEEIHEAVHGAVEAVKSAQAALEMGISRSDAFDMIVEDALSKPDDDTEEQEGAS